MKKLAALLCGLLLGISSSCFADQYITVLGDRGKVGQVDVFIPYIDGNEDVFYEKKMNAAIDTAAQKMAKDVGEGTISYAVGLNRPSLVSILMVGTRKDGSRVEQALNLDLTTGEEFTVGDFYVSDENLAALLPENSQCFFREEGIAYRLGSSGPYDKLVPYRALATSLRIGEAGRIFKITRLTGNCAGKEVTLPSDGLFALKLEAEPEQSYGWHLANENELGGQVKKVGSSFAVPNYKEAMDSKVRMLGLEFIFFAKTTEAPLKLKLEYRRGWEKKVEKSFEFIVK